MTQIVKAPFLRLSVASIALFSMGCAAQMDANAFDDEVSYQGIDEQLPIGDVENAAGDDEASDGNWGAATTCKPIPTFPALAQPEIFISTRGLTVRLIDRATGFEKVFPGGVGAIDTERGTLTTGESHTLWPVRRYKTNRFTIKRTGRTPCAIWHQASGTPLFAGLPFISFSGSYGLHGPIDNYRAANGGSLRRGYVSHGCVRMESEGILELYSRIRNSSSIPVTVVEDYDRREDGSIVDIENKWIGSPCRADSECNYEGGVCSINRNYSVAKSDGTSEEIPEGICTMPCTNTCPDRAGAAATFCAATSAIEGQTGMCVVATNAQHSDCRAFVETSRKTVARPNASKSAQVCMPTNF